MKNTKSNSDHNLSELLTKVPCIKTTKTISAQKFWIDTNLASLKEISITWARKLQMEWFKKEIKEEIIRNNFEEENFVNFLL